MGGSYVWGACSPGSRTFDCSGLTKWAYARAGMSTPHSSAAVGAMCNESVSQAQPGDILWRPGHVAIYLGGGRVVEACNPSLGIRVNPINYGGTFVRAYSPSK